MFGDVELIGAVVFVDPADRGGVLATSLGVGLSDEQPSPLQQESIGSVHLRDLDSAALQLDPDALLVLDVNEEMSKLVGDVVARPVTELFVFEEDKIRIREALR